jgi:cytochrome c
VYGKDLLRIAAILLLWQGRPRLATAQDASRGERLYVACQLCHGGGPTRATAPTLVGIVGRRSAAVAGFHYSRAMRSAGLVWNERTLDEYLADPQRLIPGNVMAFSGWADAKDRADLIAYLVTLSRSSE